MREDKKFIVSGGGAKSQTIIPDNLFSEDQAEILIGIGEGPIEGFENGEKSIYIDNTQLVNDDGEPNFEEFSIDLKHGDISKDETVVFKLGGSSNQISTTGGSQELMKDVPRTEFGISANIDYIDIRIQVGALYKSNSKGTFNNTVNFKIEYRPTNSNEWILYGTRSITGKTGSGYAKDYRIAVLRTDSPYAVRVTKLTDDTKQDDNGYGQVNKLYWTGMEEVVATNKQFDNTALFHINIKTSDQISSIPDFSAIYKLLKVKIPSNYDPINKTYTGTWDGTFQIAWTDNPAWCLYDYLTNDRYGVSSFYPIKVDKWDFYEAGKYCDEKVPDGRGGYEARYTFNGIIQEEMSGREMINYIAATFNGTVYEDASGEVHLRYEKNEQAVHLFSEENITSEGFSYSFSDPSSQYNDYNVTFCNTNLQWADDKRRVHDQDNINAVGRIPYDFVAVGCIKESEAIRRARFLMITGLTETMSVTFKTTRAGLNVNVFDTILVADSTMGYSTHGRISSVDSTRMSVKLRDEIWMEAGVDYTLVLQSNGGVIELPVDVKEVGYVKDIYLGDYVPGDIPENTVFSLMGRGDAKPFRVLKISEQDGSPDTVSITAVEINRNKQHEADYGVELPEVEYNKLPHYEQIPHITGLKINSYYVKEYKQTYTEVKPQLDNEEYPFYSGEFKFYSKKHGDENASWQEYTVEFGDTIVDHPGGTYDIRVIPKTTLGKTPSFDTAPIFVEEIFDLAVPPADVRNFVATPSSVSVRLTWDEVEDSDLMCYEIREGSFWDTAEVIASNLTDVSYTVMLSDGGEHEYLIKAKDILGTYSVNPSYVRTSAKVPSGISKFWVTPHYDNIRFDWVAESDPNVEYEVRMGAAWDSAVMLFRTKGFNQTILNPGDASRGFFIRARSSLGVYSEEYRYAELAMELSQNRNVILSKNNAAEGWVGVTNGLELTQYDDVLAMKDGVFFAEHYFPVHLEEVTRARNWYDTEAFKFGDRLKWEELDYAWGSEEAEKQTWIGSSVLTAGEGSVTPVISYELTTPYSSNLGFRFDGTSSDVSGEVVPSYETQVNFGGARYSEGLVLNRIVGLSYKSVNIDALHSIKFRVKMTAGSVSKFSIMRYVGENGASLRIYVEDNKMIFEWSDGSKASWDIRRMTEVDYISVVLNQSSSKRTIDFSVEYANIKETIEVDGGPVGSFNSVYIGERAQ